MSRPFTVLRPVQVTTSNFVSSNIAEVTYPNWVANTTYTTGTRVTHLGYVYEARVNHSGISTTPPNDPTRWKPLFPANNPTWTSGGTYTLGQRVSYQRNIYEALQAHSGRTTTPDLDTAFWGLVGPTNTWAAFDEAGGTFTQATDTIEFVVSGNRADSIALLDLVAGSVRIRAFNAQEGTYYDNTITLEDQALVVDWYQYFFTPVRRKSQVFVFDIPPISNSQYTITITGVGNVQIGTFAMGQRKEFGFTQYGAKAGIRNYGRTVVDGFGRTTFVRRGFAKTMDVTLYITRELTDIVQKELAELRDVAAIYIATPDQYETLTVYGRFIDFNIDITYPEHNFCSIQIEGLV